MGGWRTPEILRDFSQILKNICSLFVNIYVGGTRRTLRGQMGSFRDLWQNDDGTKSYGQLKSYFLNKTL